MEEKWQIKIRWLIQIKKTILIEKVCEELNSVCSKFKEQSGATDMEVKSLLKELARVFRKYIDEDYNIDWEV